MFSSEQLNSSTSKGRFTLIITIVKRKDEVYRRLVDEFKIIENVHTEYIQYDRSCYKSFTSKHNLSASVFSTTAQNVSKPTVNTISVSRSSDIVWSVCVICQCKICTNETTNYTRLHPMREQKDF